MMTKLFVSAVLVAGLGAPAYAGGITDVSGLGGSPASIDWSQLGSDGSFLASPGSVTDSDGRGAVVSSAGGSFYVVSQGVTWNGNFAPGEALLWTGGAGPDFTLTFAAPVAGAGAYIQANYFGPFTAQITVNGTDTFTENGDSNGDVGSAIFIGWSGGAISTIAFTLTSASLNPNDFAIGTVYSSAVPELSTWGMMGLGFLGLGFAGYRARRSAAVAA